MEMIPFQDRITTQSIQTYGIQEVECQVLIIPHYLQSIQTKHTEGILLVEVGGHST